MLIIIIPKLKLLPEVEQALSLRITAPEHQHDNGAIVAWNSSGAASQTYIALLEQSNKTRVAFGLLTAGGPSDSTAVAWWIDYKYRGRHLGKPMIDAMAILLRDQGVTAIGRIPIDTFAAKYNQQSIALAQRLRSHFTRDA